jgi:hypothetical protein
MLGRWDNISFPASLYNSTPILPYATDPRQLGVQCRGAQYTLKIWRHSKYAVSAQWLCTWYILNARGRKYTNNAHILP